MATELSVEGFENHVQGHFLKVFHITKVKGSPLQNWGYQLRERNYIIYE